MAIRRAAEHFGKSYHRRPSASNGMERFGMSGDHQAGAFSSVAAFYETLFDSEARLRREAPVLKQVYAQAPGNRVLDMACGTGVHALLLAQWGADVDARDLGAAMIEHAQNVRPHPHVQYAQGDMRTLEGGPWDLALCLGNSLSLLAGSEEVLETFRATQRALAPGGHLLVQILHYANPSATQARHTVSTKTHGEWDVLAVKSLVPQNERVFLSLNFHARQGADYQSTSQTAMLYPFSRETLEDCARETGLTPAGLFGSLDGAPFDPSHSSDLILLFTR